VDVLGDLQKMPVDAVRVDDVGPVETELESRGGRQLPSQDRAAVLIRRVEPGHDPVTVELLDLIAVHRVVEEEGEVRDQVELVILPVRLDVDGIGVGESPTKIGVSVEALRVAALTVVDGPESVDETQADRSLGNFPRREPVAREIRRPY